MKKRDISFRSSRACSRPVSLARISWGSLLKAATRETATSRSDCIALHSSLERYTRDYTISAPIIIPIARGHCDIKRTDDILSRGRQRKFVSDRSLLVLAPKILTFMLEHPRGCQVLSLHKLLVRVLYFKKRKKKDIVIKLRKHIRLFRFKHVVFCITYDR